MLVNTLGIKLLLIVTLSCEVLRHYLEMINYNVFNRHSNHTVIILVALFESVLFLLIVGKKDFNDKFR